MKRWMFNFGVMLVVAAAVMLAWDVLQTRQGHEAVPTPSAALPALPMLPSAPSADATPGLPGPEAGEEPSVAIDLALLTTTVSATHPERNRAHLRDRVRDARYVVALDQVLPGYEKLKVEFIDDGEVTLNHDGQLIQLFIDPDATWPEDPSQRPAPVALTEHADLLDAPPDWEEQQENLRQSGGAFYELYKRNLGLRNDEALFQQAHFLPEKREGRQVGYFAQRINKGSFWDILGLRAGDIIIEVNGIPVDGPESNRDAIRDVFRSDTRVQIMVERDGDIVDMNTQTPPVVAAQWDEGA